MRANDHADRSVEELRRQGIEALRERRCEEAADQFEEAVRRAPEDWQSRYGRGLSLSCLGEYDAAIADLHYVSERRPGDARVALELGATLTSAGDYDAAEPALRRAQRSAELEGPASLLLGIGLLRRQRPREAREELARVEAAAPELAIQAAYYAGIADFDTGRLPAARKRFERVVEERPGTTIGREAERFLEAIRQEAPRTYAARGGVGFEYDSNVVLAPDDVDLSGTALADQADGRFTIRAGGAWNPLREPLRLGVTYDFFHSLHLDLSDFDLQAHQPGLALSRSWGPIQAGADAQYQYFLRKRDLSRFLHQWMVRPWVTLRAGELGVTRILYRYRGRAFLDDDFDDLDGANHAAAIQQVVRLSPSAWILRAAYRFDRDDLVDTAIDPNVTGPVDENAFSYYGHQLGLDLIGTLPGEIRGSIGYAFWMRDYADESALADGSGARRDDQHRASLTLERPIDAHFTIVAGYLAIVNRSNQEFFEYNRHVGMLSLWATY